MGARTAVLIGVVAGAHFAVTLALGVLAFATQGDFDRPAPPSLSHRALSAVIAGLEFPAVWAVRRLDPERLRGFGPAAVVDSLLWGIGLVFLARGVPWRHEPRR